MTDICNEDRGSLAGLMQGIVIKRLGHNVTILERCLSSTREGQAAGIVTMEHSHRFMEGQDLLKAQPYAVPCSGVQLVSSSGKRTGGFDRPMWMASWNVLYHRLRANFDGLTSPYCPKAPRESNTCGSATYDQGKQVTNLRYSNEIVTVECEDLAAGPRGKTLVQADLVIAADGSRSQVRSLLQPHLRHEYAGYVAWRGTVLESDVSEDTRNLLQHKTTLHASHQGYIAVYLIPGLNGSLEPGKRLYNFVWYTNIARNSPDLTEAMTDRDGHTHHNTLPIGKIRDEVWTKQRALAKTTLPYPMIELIDKTTEPFISAIFDMDVSRPSFFEGKLLFVGDALVPFRPHVACSTNQAALDALLVEKLIKGEISLPKWESQVLEYAHLTRLRSITWGSWYQSGYIAFFFSEARYLLEACAQRLRGYLYARAQPTSDREP